MVINNNNDKKVMYHHGGGGIIRFASPDIDGGVLSNEDVFIGTILAFALAFLFSFLQGRTPSSSNIILWNDNDEDSKAMNDDYLMSNKMGEHENSAEELPKETVFDGDMWKEMSRLENYSAYTKSLDRSSEESKYNVKKDKPNSGRNENRLVLLALLILFVPIFSVEFFFALSRQFVCGDYVTSVDDTLWILDAKKAEAAVNGSSPWAAKLCSPAIMMYLE